MSVSNLHKARIEKNDEFYTLLEDIEKELVFYKDQFENKVVYCNCDNPDESNFYRYFKNNFINLKLKKLICSCCIDDEHSFYCIYDGGKEIRNKFEDDFFYTKGDFRSKECIELLKSADIVVTNPPFSLFREFINLLVECNKKFIVIGNLNEVVCIDIFTLIINNKLWLGNTMKGSSTFKVPEHYKEKYNAEYVKFGNCRWYTNIDYKERHKDLPLEKHYTQKEYPMYDNYNAIEVNKVRDIPIDYDGLMGVPITFLDVYNPDQFKIVGASREGFCKHIMTKETSPDPLINGIKKYKRIFIKSIDKTN